jgi:hypothetical protein
VVRADGGQFWQSPAWRRRPVGGFENGMRPEPSLSLSLRRVHGAMSAALAGARAPITSTPPGSECVRTIRSSQVMAGPACQPWTTWPGRGIPRGPGLPGAPCGTLPATASTCKSARGGYSADGLTTAARTALEHSTQLDRKHMIRMLVWIFNYDYMSIY